MDLIPAIIEESKHSFKKVCGDDEDFKLYSLISNHDAALCWNSISGMKYPGHRMHSHIHYLEVGRNGVLSGWIEKPQDGIIKAEDERQVMFCLLINLHRFNLQHMTLSTIYRHTHPITCTVKVEPPSLTGMLQMPYYGCHITVCYSDGVQP